MNSLNRIVTRTGIVIGGAYTEPPPQPSADADRIQAAFLARQRAARSWMWAHRVIGAVGLGVAMALFMGLLR